MVKPIDHLHRTIWWLQDRERGEMIQSRSYKRDCLSFSNACNSDLDYICKLINHNILEKGSIYNSNGEIIPTSITKLKENYF